MAAYDVYSRQLLGAKRGYPLYEPDAVNECDSARVGDVGIFQEGKFRRAFNVFLDEDDAMNGLGVPEEFGRAKGRMEEMFKRTPIPPGVVTSSKVHATTQGKGKATYVQ